MRSYAEQYHNGWWILSAKHGLLDPGGEPIEPYDETLSGARKAKKRGWAERVAEQLDEEGLFSDDVTLVFHAGKDYYEELLPHIDSTGASIEIPTEGLSIGNSAAESVRNRRGIKSDYDGKRLLRSRLAEPRLV